MTEPARQSNAFPRGPLYGAGALLLVALCAAGAGRVFGADGRPPASHVLAARDLTFEDRADGAVIVADADHPGHVTVMTGENGFLRGTLRGLARTRRSEGIGPALPFRLTAWTDGRLTLDDPSTGREIELEAFGSLNEAVFARLLPAPARAS
jgi:putative photosynthetic complex assembly protein